MPPTCATGSIAPYVPSAALPWNRERAIHLFKRMGFGASPEEIDNVLPLSPTSVVDLLIDQAIALPIFPEPEWAYWAVSDYTDIETQALEQYYTWRTQWVTGMLNDNLRDRLSFFWSNHLVARADDYQCPSYLYQYHRLLQQYALGNYKDFVYEMGKSPAMLIFLNGFQNTKFEPNENYARELYELFTLGADNGYTQNDITETARALTGFNGVDPYDFCGPIEFVPFFHDDGPKTIFGQTGNWGYDELINILFEQRGDLIAQYICTKIYREFVSREVDQTIIAELATTFLDNNFELAPVFRQLFKSEHFFDEANISVQIKGPLDSFLMFVKDLGIAPIMDDEFKLNVGFVAAELGQDLFNPLDVAGWPGNRDWVTNTSLTGRWQIFDLVIFSLYEDAPELLRDFAKGLSDNSTDPEVVTRALVNYFVHSGLQNDTAYESCTNVFKSEVPQNYFDEGLWNLDWEFAPAQVALLMQHISRLPEFQLY